MNPSNIITMTLAVAALTSAAASAQQIIPQNVEITSQTSTSPNLKTTGPGGVLFGGTFGTGVIPASGAGVRMMWYPKKAAFRVGMVTNNSWDDNMIGEHSMGVGGNATATGFGSVALGSAQAVGHQSFAAGWGSQATADFSVALGPSVASGYMSFAAAAGTAHGYQSVALQGGLALGYHSVAIGSYAVSTAVQSVVVGQFNEQIGNTTQSAASDPIFVVGTGTSVNAPKNGFAVLRDGRIRIQRQGDVGMGRFGNTVDQ